MGFPWDFHGISMGFIGDLDHLVNSMGLTVGGLDDAKPGSPICPIFPIKTPPMHPEEPKKPYGKMMGILRVPLTLNFMDSLDLIGGLLVESS